MGLVFNTVLFVLVNVAIGSLLLSSQGATSSYNGLSSGLNGSDSSIDFDNVNDIDNYQVSEGSFDNTGVPIWFKSLLLLIDGVWGVAILIGWIRGQH